jgi:iron-sulfur cluster assembly protein
MSSLLASPMAESQEQQEVPFSFSVTDKAVEALKKALEGRELSSVGLKLSVHPGGCSGFSYGLSFQEAPEQNEAEVTQNGVRMFVEKTTLPLLSGIEIDYVDSLMGGGFKINNPNASSTCGCGKSFS